MNEAKSAHLVRTSYYTNYVHESGPSAGQRHAAYEQIHAATSDKCVDDHTVLQNLMDDADIQDGDGFEIIVRKTGDRPFGDREVRLTKPHTYERESE